MKQFKRIANVGLNGKTFTVFKDEKNKYAFLELKDDTFYYPKLKDLVELVEIFSQKEKNMMYLDRDVNYNSQSDNNTFNNDINNNLTVNTYTNLNNNPSSVNINKGKRKKKKKIYNFVPKLLAASATLVISAQLFNIALNNPDFVNRFNNVLSTETTSNGYEISNETIADVSVDEIEETIADVSVDEIEETIEDEITQQSAITYNPNKYAGRSIYSASQVIDALNANDEIDQQFKPFIIDYINTMDAYYTNINWDTFYNNIKTLKIVEDHYGNISEGMEACYRSDFNAIFLKELKIPIEGSDAANTWRHELTHLFIETKTSSFCDNDLYGYYTREYLTVVLSSKPFMDRYPSYVSSNLGYPRFANIFNVLDQCFTTFEISEYTYGNINNFTKLLDNEVFIDDGDDFCSLLEVVSTQFYNSHGMSIDQNDVDKLTAYVFDAWKLTYLNPSMSEDEVYQCEDVLVAMLNKGIESNQVINFDKLHNSFVRYATNELESSKGL